MENSKCLIISALNKEFTNGEILEQIHSYKSIIEDYNINNIYISKRDALSLTIIKLINNTITINEESVFNEYSDIYEIKDFLEKENIDVLIVVGFTNNREMLFSQMFFGKNVKVFKLCTRQISNGFCFQ